MTSARSNSNRQKSLKLPAGHDNSDKTDSLPVDSFLPRVLVSGGQTGVDRAALDVAIDQGIQHAGWCPAGRVAEDGPIPSAYQLRETASSDYSVRTEQNVIDSDATLILFHTTISGGTKLTIKFARRHARPVLTVDLSACDLNDEVTRCKIWLNDVRPARLNIAGPRESNVPGIYNLSKTFLRSLFAKKVI